MTERRCKECGDTWFLVDGADLCRDCQKWNNDLRPEVITARLKLAAKRKPNDEDAKYQRRK